MKSTDETAKQLWEESFREQIQIHAYNTAPVEALARDVAYYLRDRYTPDQTKKLHFLEMGCGAGPNLVWLAERGIKVSGIDIAPTALDLARQNLDQRGYKARVGKLVEGSVAQVPFPDQSFDGILEACVFQHLNKEDRVQAFREVGRLLKPGGVFVGYMLSRGHTIYQKKKAEERKEDPGTLVLQSGTSKVHLSNIGLSHFFAKEEFAKLLPGFKVVDPGLLEYQIPKEEARKRGYDEYLQSMWTVYAIK